jgi:LL-diaminopimelate aminotransferase
MPLLEDTDFLPDLKAIPDEARKKARLMFLNYPNNPTSAVASRQFFEEAVEFARQHEILLCHDAAYAEVYYDDERPLSLMEIPGAREIAIEFNSLSKPYNMTGWRIGWACGNADAVTSLGKIKSNIDSGIFQAVQEAGIEALTGDQKPLDQLRMIYQERRDMTCGILTRMGFSLQVPRAAFYLWVKTPEGQSSAGFASRLLEETGVVVTPGNGFGQYGEGYFRISLTVDGDRLSEALSRIEAVKF